MCECVCKGPACSTQGAVCGTDGKTYTNHKDLVIYACQKNLTIKPDYKGECKGKTSASHPIGLQLWLHCH